MLLLFTDFGAEGPYLGQMEAVLKRYVPASDVVNLLSNAPIARPRLSSYLLAALSRQFDENTVFLCVVDPGVGGPREPVVVEADGRWFVGPDNGLFNTVAVQAKTANWWTILWRPSKLSVSFHGRDLFAPVAARIASGERPQNNREFKRYKNRELDAWPVDAAEIVYIDHYGNGLSGRRFQDNMVGNELSINGANLIHANTFSEVPQGQAFWYQNSLGLVEIAVNQGHAATALGFDLGTAITIG